MKKIIALLGLLLLVPAAVFAGDETTTAPAYATRSFNVRNFTQIDISGIVDLTVEKSDRFSVEVTLPESVEKYLVVKVSDGCLKIGVENIPASVTRRLKDWTLTARVTMPLLHGLEMSGATRFRCDDTFDLGGKDFELEMSGASRASNLLLRNARELEIEMGGATSLSLQGDCTVAEIDMSGASRAAFELDARKLMLDCSGASKPRLKGMYDEVSVEASGASEPTLSGSAKTLFAEVSGASKFRARELPVPEVRLIASGAAKCEVAAQRKLSAEASGGSDVRYLSSPGLETILNIGRGASLSVLR